MIDQPKSPGRRSPWSGFTDQGSQEGHQVIDQQSEQIKMGANFEHNCETRIRLMNASDSENTNLMDRKMEFPKITRLSEVETYI